MVVNEVGAIRILVSRQLGDLVFGDIGYQDKTPRHGYFVNGIAWFCLDFLDGYLFWIVWM